MKRLRPRFGIGLMRFRLSALDITSLHDISALNDRGPVFDNTVLCLPSSSLDRLAHHASTSLPSSGAVQWVVGLLLLAAPCRRATTVCRSPVGLRPFTCRCIRSRSLCGTRRVHDGGRHRPEVPRLHIAYHAHQRQSDSRLPIAPSAARDPGSLAPASR